MFLTHLSENGDTWVDIYVILLPCIFAVFYWDLRKYLNSLLFFDSLDSRILIALNYFFNYVFPKVTCVSRTVIFAVLVAPNGYFQKFPPYFKT